MAQTQSCPYCMGTGKSGARSPSWCVPCAGTGYLTTYGSSSSGGSGGRGGGGGGSPFGILILLGLAWFFWGPDTAEKPVRQNQPPQSTRDVAPERTERNGSAAEPRPAPRVSTTPPTGQPAILVVKAEHKHSFGKECRGNVAITLDEFQYVSDGHPLAMSRREVARIDGSGLVDLNGKKWHFRLEGINDEEVEELLTRWLAGEDLDDRE